MLQAAASHLAVVSRSHEPVGQAEIGKDLKARVVQHHVQRLSLGRFHMRPDGGGVVLQNVLQQAFKMLLRPCLHKAGTPVRKERERGQ